MTPARVKPTAFRRGLGAAVETFRTAAPMDRETLSKKVGFQPLIVKSIEEGGYEKLTVWELEKIAEALKVRPSQIMALAETLANRGTRKRR